MVDPVRGEPSPAAGWLAAGSPAAPGGSVAASFPGSRDALVDDDDPVASGGGSADAGGSVAAGCCVDAAGWAAAGGRADGGRMTGGRPGAGRRASTSACAWPLAAALPGRASGSG